MDANRPVHASTRSATLDAALKRSPAIEPSGLYVSKQYGPPEAVSSTRKSSGQHPFQPLTGHPPIAPLSAPRLARYRAAWPHPTSLLPRSSTFSSPPNRPSRTSTPSITAEPSPSSRRRQQTSSTSQASRRSSPIGRSPPARQGPVSLKSIAIWLYRWRIDPTRNRTLGAVPPTSRPVSARGRLVPPT